MLIESNDHKLFSYQVIFHSCIDHNAISVSKKRYTNCSVQYGVLEPHLSNQVPPGTHYETYVELMKNNGLTWISFHQSGYPCTMLRIRTGITILLAIACHKWIYFVMLAFSTRQQLHSCTLYIDFHIYSLCILVCNNRTMSDIVSFDVFSRTQCDVT